MSFALSFIPAHVPLCLFLIAPTVSITIPFSSASCSTISFYLSASIKQIYSLNHNPPLSYVSPFPIACLSLSLEGLYSCKITSPSLPPCLPFLSLGSNSLDAVLHVDGYWFFFLLFASLFLFAPLCTLCQHRYARPTVYSTPPCVWVRACWLWGRWGVRREEDCPTVSHDIITCRNFLCAFFHIHKV